MNAIRIYFVVVGLLSLAGAAYLLARRIHVWGWGSTAAGVVVAHQVRQSEDSVFHLPVVSFMDDAGHEHRFTSVAGSTARRPQVGTRVTVRYLPSNPNQAYIDTFLHLWAAPLALVVLGAAGCAVLFVE